MPLTTVVVKFLAERNSNRCSPWYSYNWDANFPGFNPVGFLFGLLPALGGRSGLFQEMVSEGRLLVVLSLYLAASSVPLVCPCFLTLMMKLSSETNGLSQLVVVAFCFMCLGKWNILLLQISKLLTVQSYIIWSENLLFNAICMFLSSHFSFDTI